MRSSVSACAPSRWASATVAASRASVRCSSATMPAPAAISSATSAAASSARRRRFILRLRSASRSLTSRACSMNSRSSSLRSVAALGGEVQRGGEPRAAVELARVAAARVPVARGQRDVPVQPPGLGVVLEPAAQPRPLPQQRLVGDLDGLPADREQPVLGQHLEDAAGRLAAVEVELGQRHLAPHGRLRLALPGEPHEDVARGRGLAGAQALVGGLRQPGDRAAHAARPVVGGDGEPVPGAALPQLEQRRRQQRQAAGLAGGVLDQAGDELGLDGEPRRGRRPFDRARDLVAPHRADEHVALAQAPSEARMARARAVEVGPQREHGQEAVVVVQQRVHERGALGGVPAGGEHLLELVDDDQQPRPGLHVRERGLDVAAGVQRASQRRERMIAGAHQDPRPALAPGEHAGGERGQQARAHRGGLAASRRPDDAEQARPRHARDDLGHQPLAPEEVAGVVDVEGLQALVGAAGRGRARAATVAQRVEVDDVAGELVLDRAQLDAVLRGAARPLADLLDGLAVGPRVVGDDEVEHGVLAQDRLLQPAQLGPGLDPERLHERPARVAERVERLGLPAGAVEREHQQRPQPLAQRMLVDQGGEPPDELRVAARVEVALDRELERRQMQLLQASRLGGRERLLAHARQRRVPPDASAPRGPAPSAGRRPRARPARRAARSAARRPRRGRRAARSRRRG